MDNKEAEIFTESGSAYRRIMERRARRRKKEIIIKTSALGCIILAVLGFVLIKVNVTHNEKETIAAVAQESGQEETKEEEEVKITIPYPVISNSYVEITSGSIQSPYIALLDVENSQIIAGRCCNERIYPASMTKVMTLIVAVENLKSLDETYALSSELLDPLVRASASRAGFDAGEVVSAKNLLYGLILPSGADAAVALANMTAGSEEAFVNLMNEKCVEMGLKNSHFMNTSGLHDENQYTTPVEMAMILEYAMLNETCAGVLSTYQYTTDPTPQHPEGIVLTSTMFSRMYGDEVEGVKITSGKTGYTNEAKNCLVSYAEKNGKPYIAVTAAAANRWYVIYDDFEIYRDYTF